MGILDEELGHKADVNDLEGLSIYEVAERLYNGRINIEVTDTEVGICPRLVYELGQCNTAREKFIDFLIRHVKVVRISEQLLTCDFSGFYKPYNDKIIDWYGDGGLSFVDNRKNAILGLGDDYGFDEYDLYDDEKYLDLVEYTEDIIDGLASEEDCKKLIEVLS